MRTIIFAMMIVWIWGCSSEPVAKTQAIKKPPVQVVEAEPVIIPVERDLGSLWSEGSTWNEVFSVGLSRKPGDIVFIKTNENFRALLAGGKLAEKIASEDVRDKSIAPIPVTIRSVLGRGIYQVSTVQQTKLIAGTITTHFSGKMREKDIGDDEIIVSEQVFDTKFDSQFVADESVNADPKKKGNEKNTEKKAPETPQKEETTT